MIQDRFANAIHMMIGSLCLLGTLPRGRFITARVDKLRHLLQQENALLSPVQDSPEGAA